jgi:uncharacterized protein (UPF0276 family)
VQRLGVGWALHSDLEYLELTREIIERDADYYEINPEALWRPRAGGLERNDYYPMYQEIRDRSGKPFVAHGLGFSLASGLDEPGERERTAQWLERLKDDQREFRFPWLSEHLGWTRVEGLQVTLPLPVPYTDETAAAVAARMRLLRTAAPVVAFENNVSYFALGDPAREPEFLSSICRAAPCSLLLDLHNVHTQCLNFGADPVDYVDRLDLDFVVQIHLSGGSGSEPGWVPSRRVFRLDSHDGPVPEPVWTLFERVLPRCRNLRGVVVERLNGTFRAKEVPALAAEVRRAKELFPC